MKTSRETTWRTWKTWRAVFFGLLFVVAALLGGCGDGQPAGGEPGTARADAGEPVSRDFYAMDTYMTVTAYGQQAAEATEAAEAEVLRLDNMLSTGTEDSEISKLNREGKAVLSQEAGSLVERGLALYDETERQFDIAICPVMAAWGFTDKNYRVPSVEELAELLPLTDPADVEVRVAVKEGVSEEAGDSGIEVSFGKKGMAIDLGGMAKGYASARIMDIFREHGVTSGLANLGGNVQMLGTKPDGSNWRVAVRDPHTDEDNEEASAEDEGAGADASQVQYLGVLEAADTAVITSGGYERYFTQDGVVYHHIIDPATGHPADSGLQSVTIVCKDGTQADALSTSLFIMGKDKAIEYWREHKGEFDCILLDQEDELYVTEPIADAFVSDLYPINVVR